MTHVHIVEAYLLRFNLFKNECLKQKKKKCLINVPCY